MFLEKVAPQANAIPDRRFDGVDVFDEWQGTGEELAARLEAKTDWGGPFELSMISNYGSKPLVYQFGDGDPINHWRCRFLYDAWDSNVEEWISVLLRSIAETVPWIHVEKLMSFDGMPGYAQADSYN